MKNYGKIEETNQRTFSAKFSSLAKIRAYMRNICKTAGFEPDKVYHITLAVDEACSNIIEHAYCGETEDQEIDCFVCLTDEALLVQLHDEGKSFDPESIPDPELDVNIEERIKGGLGLFFIRKFMDELLYQNIPFFPVPKLSTRNGNYLLLVKYKSEMQKED